MKYLLWIVGIVGFRGERYFGTNEKGYHVFYPYVGFNDPWRSYADRPVFYKDKMTIAAGDGIYIFGSGTRLKQMDRGDFDG